MKNYADKNQEQKSQAVANESVQKRSNSEATFELVDNRPKAVAQRKLIEMANSSPRTKRLAAMQDMANSSVRGNKMAQLFGKKASVPEPVQCAAIVTANKRKGSVVIKASGKVDEFQDGEDAKDQGWNGVEKYKARVIVGEERKEAGPYTNDYLVAQSGHVLAQQNGGDGTDSDNVFAQDGGMNNSIYRKEFENPMRRMLDNAKKDTEVSFRAVLYGDSIKKGTLKKESDSMYGSEPDTDGTTDSGSESSSSSDADEPPKKKIKK